MNKRLLLTLLCIVLAPRASQAQAQKVPVAVTWDYRAETKTLLVHATCFVPCLPLQTLAVLLV